MPNAKCYLCMDIDPDETRFNPPEHGICSVCADKLRQIANSSAAFKVRDSVVLIHLADPDVVQDAIKPFGE